MPKSLILDNLAKVLNNTVHSTTKRKPIEIDESNWRAVKDFLNRKNALKSNISKKSPFKIGQPVRVVKEKALFMRRENRLVGQRKSCI